MHTMMVHHILLVQWAVLEKQQLKTLLTPQRIIVVPSRRQLQCCEQLRKRTIYLGFSRARK